MGNREDLLDAATRCLESKGYVRTSARDVATAANVSLAAIGYHYGSKDALLQAALRQALERWGDELARSLAATPLDDDPVARFTALWDAIVASFAANPSLWRVQFEVLAQPDLPDELRGLFRDAHRQARLGLVELFGGAPDGEAPRVGAVYQALLGGLAAIWLADPAGPPSGDDLLAAIRAVASTLH
ncbi:TetR/AcrR family transcriptional regulator [Cryptosporangium phraense]|uniref:TetR/AcrR family transcriptional regulator n=1 Tax=Cryptosporangium phraense TaxID=2593070 RepID=A0A545AMK5_9ACTN|nr:TetR/AcrR family transcriptional regulator [Cryptosporangium phraense]TQS41965.1 TetR/AcrR family transcriptional regulator [Cryptosporangium phraense]